MAVKLQKAEEELKIEKQRLKERVLQIESLVAEAEVRDVCSLEELLSLYLCVSLKRPTISNSSTVGGGLRGQSLLRREESLSLCNRHLLSSRGPLLCPLLRTHNPKEGGPEGDMADTTDLSRWKRLASLPILLIWMSFWLSQVPLKCEE
jgi:hypothetical protein